MRGDGHQRNSSVATDRGGPKPPRKLLQFGPRFGSQK
jgi:hypothetical protein